MSHVQRKLLTQALEKIEQYEVQKTWATLEIRKKGGKVIINYRKEPQTYEGEYDTETKVLTKEHWNITNRHILSIMESEIVFNGENRSNFNTQKPQFIRGPRIK